MSRFFPTVLLDRHIEKRMEVAEMLEGEEMQKAADRVRHEIKGLRALKRKAENWNGPVAEVAEVVGYTPSHLHGLIRDHLIENVAPEGEERRVRYADVLNHRLKDMPSDDTPVVPLKRNGQPPRTNGTARTTRKNGPRVKITVGA